jgi:hypothetical protein
VPGLLGVMYLITSACSLVAKATMWHGVIISTAMCGVDASGCRCVAGNCFSLQREHESAVRLFQRALQLDPHMSYAGMLRTADAGDSHTRLV